MVPFQCSDHNHGIIHIASGSMYLILARLIRLIRLVCVRKLMLDLRIGNMKISFRFAIRTAFNVIPSSRAEVRLANFWSLLLPLSSSFPIHFSISMCLKIRCPIPVSGCVDVCINFQLLHTFMVIRAVPTLSQSTHTLCSLCESGLSFSAQRTNICTLSPHHEFVSAA